MLTIKVQVSWALLIRSSWICWGSTHDSETVNLSLLWQMYYLAYDKAKDMLQKNQLALEKIVDELLEFEILTGKV